MTEEQQKEWSDRRQKFLDAYKVLIDEHKCDFISMPQFLPSQSGAWEIKVVTDIMDMTDAPVKSPFIAQ